MVRNNPLWYLVPHRHICAIPHFATYRAIIVRKFRSDLHPLNSKGWADAAKFTILTLLSKEKSARAWVGLRFRAWVREMSKFPGPEIAQKYKNDLKWPTPKTPSKKSEILRTRSTTTRDRNLQFRGAVSTGGSPVFMCNLVRRAP